MSSGALKKRILTHQPSSDGLVMAFIYFSMSWKSSSEVFLPSSAALIMN